MSRYTIDFSPAPTPRPSRWPNRRMMLALRKATFVLSGLLCAIALVGMLRVGERHESLQEIHNRQLIRYDSLLSTKLQTDRQLSISQLQGQRLQAEINQLRRRVAELSRAQKSL